MADVPVVTNAAPAPVQSVPDTQTPKAEQADPRLEIFAKKERQLRQQQQQLAKDRADMEQRLKSYETDYIPKSRLTSDPLSVLEESGLSYDKLTELLLSQPNQNDPATRAMLNKIKALEEKQSAIERQAQDQTKQQYDQAIKQIDNEVKLMVDSDVEFETIKSLGMHDAVTELIKTTFDTEGRLIDISEAAKQVESYLVEEGFKIAQVSKVQARLKPKEETTANSALKPPQADNKQGLKTLTNNIPSQPAKRLSEKERRERAIRAFKGEAI